MPKRKNTGNYSDDANDDNVPIPIQFFFWNQTSLFIKQKFGNLTEAHALNFERVLAQNILHGLSPGLSDAINSISRWSFIKASFPHIIHACSAALAYRKENSPDSKLTKTETKLLYTLHWLMLDAASECEDSYNSNLALLASKRTTQPPQLPSADSGASSDNRKPLGPAKSVDMAVKSKFTFLHSLSTIELFVYMFIPILKSIKREDLDNLKLGNGLKIWNALWSHRQPDIPIFNTPVKQRLSTNNTTETAASPTAKPEEKSFNPKKSFREVPVVEVEVKDSKYKPVTVTKSTDSAVVPVTSKTVTSTFGDIYMGGDNENANANTSKPQSANIELKIDLKLDDNSEIFSYEDQNVYNYPSSSSREVTPHMPKSTSFTEALVKSSSEKRFPSNRLQTRNSESSLKRVSMLTSDEVEEMNKNNNVGIMRQVYFKDGKLNIEKELSESLKDSEFDTDSIRDSCPVLSPSTTTDKNLLKAPLVHMSSICSFSDNSTQFSTPTNSSSSSSYGKRLGSEPRTEKVEELFTCHKCNSPFKSSIVQAQDTEKTKTCEKCLESESKGPQDDKNLGPKRSSSLVPPSPTKSHTFASQSIKQMSRKGSSMEPKTSAPILEDEKKEKATTGPFSNKDVKAASFFDVAVLRCLLSPKWHPDGYLWSLEYLSYRVTEITDFTLKEQDKYMKSKSESTPFNLNDMCIQLGADEVNGKRREFSYFEDTFKFNRNFLGCRSRNPFIQLLNQILVEDSVYKNDAFSADPKRKRLEYNFQARIRRIRYIDEDLQPRKSHKMAAAGPKGSAYDKNLPSFSQLSVYMKNSEGYKSYEKLDEEFNMILAKRANKQKLDDVSYDSRTANQQGPRPAGLTRSYSDTELNYKDCYSDTEEASGSAGLINSDGTLNLNIVLKGIHSVILKENSIKVCELVLNILDNLLNIDLMPTEEVDQKLEQAKIKLNLTEASIKYIKNLEDKFNENFYLATDLALKNIKWLGCHNCQKASKTFFNDQLRGKIKLLLARLYKKNPKRFGEFFKSFINTAEINYLIETFHALFGYCLDPYSGFSHYYPYVNINSANQVNISKNAWIYSRNNENENKRTMTTINIENVMIGLIFKPLVKRLITNKREIMNQENLYLFSDIRCFIAYIKENHGGIFRKIAFSNMLDPLIKLKQDIEIHFLKLKNVNIKLAELKELQEKCMSDKAAINAILNALPREASELKFTSIESVSNKNDSSNQLNALEFLTGKSSNRKTSIDNSIVNPSPGKFEGLREKTESVKSKNRLVHLSTTHSIASQSDLLTTDRGAESPHRLRDIKKINERKLKSKSRDRRDFSDREADASDLESIRKLIESTMRLKQQFENEKHYVNSGVVYKGVEYYRFLIECLPPGSVPDVPFMSALLELEAPLISKAAFLLETAYFVNRCNRKDWPEWIKMNIGICRPYGSFASNKNAPNASKRNKIYQLAAANMFLAWGEVLSDKLDSLIENSQKEPFMGEKKEYEAEDYFNEELVNPSGNNCPYALQNIVCILLLEITCFLRESYQYMPKKILTGGLNYGARMEHNPGASVNKSNSRDLKPATSSSSNTNDNNPTKDPSSTVIINKDEPTTTDNQTYIVSDMNSTGNDNENGSDSGANVQSDSEHPKHISFADKKEDKKAPGTAQFDANDDIVPKSSGVIASRNGPAINPDAVPPTATTATTPVAAVDPSKAQPTYNQKRNSFKNTRRPSLKYRIDRAQRNTHFTSSSAGRRKASRNNSISQHNSDDRQENESYVHSQGNAESDTVAGPNSPEYASASGNFDMIQANDYEVEEIDYNRCFPWIKVIVKFLDSINYECKHLNLENVQDKNSHERCSMNCYLKRFKSSHSLIEAILRMYESSKNINFYDSQNREGLIKEAQKGGFGITSSIFSKDGAKNLLAKPKESIMSAEARGSLRSAAEKKIHETVPTIEYLNNQIQNLNQIPLLLICKSVLIMSDDLYVRLVNIAWRLLLNSDQEIVTSAVTIFLISSIKQPALVEELLRSELKSFNVNVRYEAVLKFKVLWKFRYHIWPRLESNAHNMLKISPPCIEFVLPSPPIGASTLQSVDPAWLPKAKTKVEEVTINQKEARAVVTASKSRKKHQQEIIHKALQADQMNKKIARENFYFTNLAYLQQASYEPFLHQSKEEQDEVELHNEEHEATFQPVNNAKRQSIAVVKRLQQRTSVAWNRKSIAVEAVEETKIEESNDIQQSQPVFPNSISTSVICLIDLLYDAELNSSGQSVSSLVNRVIWNCLVDDTALFMRYIFEKITQRDKKNYIIQYLRRLINFYAEFPPQTGFVLLNYLLGVVMYYVRTPAEGCQEAISSILTLIWQVISSVNGIVFKDLKQTLKKEQCDPSILITANVPSAKRVIVHGPDLGQIPTQVIINEDTQFSYVMQESFDFFGISDAKKDKYFLYDLKTNQIHIPDTYVRNFYFFRRNYYPQLSLRDKDPKETKDTPKPLELLEKTAFNLKVLEQSKVLLFRKMFESTPTNQFNSTASFLHEELMKLPMFPRKSLEADFSLFPKLSDRELLSSDMLHKYSWCQLIWSLFSSIDCKTASTWDITLFINVINGSFILHCEDLIVIRTCLAIYISTARQFKHIFATNGFLLIIPSLMKVYSNMQANPMLKGAIEFACLQFYIMHRIPFMLQLFGSVAQMLDSSVENKITSETQKMYATCLFNLILSMENNVPDALKILELVKINNQYKGTQASSSSQTASEKSANEPGTTKELNPPTLHHPSGPVGSMGIGSLHGTSNLAASTLGFNSPAATVLANTTSTSTVLAVSGISATNLLISSSGALGISQIANLSSLNTNLSGPTNMNYGALTVNLAPTLLNTGMPISSHTPLNSGLAALQAANNRSNENYRNMIRALDFCYNDDDDSKFNIIDAINLCVTVIAYATHAFRANQMLAILDVIVPQYLNHLKAQTESNTQGSPMQDKHHYVSFQSQQESVHKAKFELIHIQKTAVAIKTLVNTADFLTRSYTGPRSETLATNFKLNTNPSSKNALNRSPSIMPDEDSMRFTDEKRPKQDFSDDKQIRQEFRSPRDTLLNVVSEFANFCSKRLKELYKIINDNSFKVSEILDSKAHNKLVEITHTLLKLWDDSVTLSGNGLQNYFLKLLPVTDWSQDEIKPAFNNLLRRIDRLFTKISKRPSSKKQIDWSALAGVLNGLYLTLDKQEHISSLPYFKLLVNSSITLVLNETNIDPSLNLINSANGFAAVSGNSKADMNFQVPVVFSKALIKLVGRYINSLKDQSNLDQLFGSAASTISPSMPSGLAYLINFLMPLLFWSASERKDSPKLSLNDISFVVTILLNALKPPSKLAATLLLQAPKQHHLMNAFDSNMANMNNNIYNKSAKQLKDITHQTIFLALKLVAFGFIKQIELTRIALAIRQLSAKLKSVYFWKFIEFICTHRSPLFLLLKPYIENFIMMQNCENDQDFIIRDTIQLKLNCTIQTNLKSKDAILNDLIDEFNSIKYELQGDRPAPSATTEGALTQTSDNKLAAQPSASSMAAKEPTVVSLQAEPTVSNADTSTSGPSVASPVAATSSSPPGSVAALSQPTPANENTSTPSRSVAFKFNISKKEQLNSGVQSPQSSSTNSPRKKLEKLNYRDGISILDIYKSKHSLSLLEDEVKNRMILESFHKSNRPAATGLTPTGQQSGAKDEVIVTMTEVARKPNLDFIENVCESEVKFSKTKRFTPTKRILKRNTTKSGLDYENSRQVQSAVDADNPSSFYSEINPPSVQIPASTKDKKKKKPKKIVHL